MKTLIFGDVHLKATADGARDRAEFARFLREIDPKVFERAIVLGDLFDFWFEYRHVVFSGYFEVLRAFAELKDRGLEMHLVCGNHDFWAGRFLEEELGFQIHPEPFAYQFGKKTVLFVHGDGVNPDDYGYRVYKRLARSRLVIGLFGLLHPDWAMAIARRVSYGSRAMFKADVPREGREVVPVRQFALDVLQRGEADVVVCGHTHYPTRETVETPRGPGDYINAGDWMEHRTFVEWDGEAFRMYRYVPGEWGRPYGPSKEDNAGIAHDVAGGEPGQAKNERDQ